jgi:hypothetical protein
MSTDDEHLEEQVRDRTAEGMSRPAPPAAAAMVAGGVAVGHSLGRADAPTAGEQAPGGNQGGRLGPEGFAGSPPDVAPGGQGGLPPGTSPESDDTTTSSSATTTTGESV